jgi:hypothetical protein
MNAAKWDDLIAEAEQLGYTVELVQWVESADCPGLLGMAEGAIIYAKKRIRIKQTLSETDRVRVLAHELEHARDPDADIETGPAWELSRTGRRRAAENRTSRPR